MAEPFELINGFFPPRSALYNLNDKYVNRLYCKLLNSHNKTLNQKKNPLQTSFFLMQKKTLTKFEIIF